MTAATGGKAPSVASPEWLECCAVCGAGDWNGWADCPEHTALTAVADEDAS